MFVYHIVAMFIWKYQEMSLTLQAESAVILKEKMLSSDVLIQI